MKVRPMMIPAKPSRPKRRYDQSFYSWYYIHLSVDKLALSVYIFRFNQRNV